MKMKNKIFKAAELLWGAGTAAVLLVPQTILATTFSNTGPDVQTAPSGANINFQTISGAVCTLTNWVFTLLTLVVVIYVLIAAYNYITSNGDEEKIKKANHNLIYAFIGLLVALLAKGIPYIIISAFGGTGFTGCT